MKRVITLLVCAGLAGFTAKAAHADSSCWSPAELQAYDITMHTLLLAHIAADCESVADADPPLRAQLAQFLGHNGKQLDNDRQALSGYFQRGYVDDWQAPLNNLLSREESRVSTQVSQAASESFCEGAADELEGLAKQSWTKYVQDAEGQGWHKQAGLPACQ